MKRLTNQMIDKAIKNQDVKLLVDYMFYIAPKARKIYHSYREEYKAYENYTFQVLIEKLDKCIEKAIKIDKEKTKKYYFIILNKRNPEPGETLHIPYSGDFL